MKYRTKTSKVLKRNIELIVMLLNDKYETYYLK